MKTIKRVSGAKLDLAQQTVIIPNKLREYDAHKKRLQQNSKLSPHKDLRIYEQKRELMKWQTIQEQNTQILARLAKISNRSPTPPSQCGTPRGRRSLKESKLRIENENNRLLSKINGMQGLIKIRQSNLKQENFQDSYLKHKKIQQNMQKFYFDNNLHKIKLRVDAYLDNLNMQKSYERSKSQHVNPRTSKLN